MTDLVTKIHDDVMSVLELYDVLPANGAIKDGLIGDLRTAIERHLPEPPTAPASPKVQEWCHRIAYNCLRQSLQSTELVIMLAAFVSATFEPHVTRLVEALSDLRDYAYSQGAVFYVKEADAALAEIGKE